MVVLKGIPSVLSPELLYTLARMGHGDEIGETPGEGNCRLVNAERDSTKLQSQAAVMDLVDSDKERGLKVPVWDEYKRLLCKAGCEAPLEKVERFSFYERAKHAFAVVATGETALYGNLILKKGVLSPSDLV
ncbi:fucose mutarotase isoform X4 [Lithobates pipiens]